MRTRYFPNECIKTATEVEMSTSEITNLTALALSTKIRAKTISCTEVLRAYLSQIDKLNPEFNALVSIRDHELLLAEAQTRDKELSKGICRGWMHGFPHAVKDLADVEDLLTTKGSPVLRDNVAAKDSIFVERIRDAGAIIIGKTNVPEFGLGSHTYNPVFGATLNAYDGKSTAGGSSGGAAAALALQMLPVADGSDFMGSLRNPAAFNNVIGFRPTPGRVPLDNMFTETLSCNGPMARNVSDTAMLLSTMAGYHSASPNSLNEDPAQFTQPLLHDFDSSKIGWLGDFNGYLAMEEGVLDLCYNALQGFRDIGCIVDEVSVDFSMEQLWDAWLVLRHWMVRSRALDLYRDEETRKLLKPEQIWEIEGGDKITGDQIFAASTARALWYEALQRAFQKYDFLVLPTAQVFPFDANIHWPQEIAGRTMDTYHRWMEVVIPGTLSGCPVINVPAGFSKQGLPMGLQIIGKRYSDLSTLQVAYAYEQATRWNLDTQPFALT
ncbi:MAG: amidase [Flavobacterium sp.]